jgi:3-keto-5-aminohexanoate cleavage enzyme
VDKVIITVATTGSRPTKEQNPNLPITPEEIANAAYECFNEGATVEDARKILSLPSRP